MTSIINFEALSGAGDESPPCYILQIDDFKFLLDCGWDEKFDLRVIEALEEHASTIDAILLSYPDFYHLGALPYLVGHLGITCPIFATIPVHALGSLFLYDIHQSHYNISDFNLFTLDDIDNAFEQITQVQYSQTVDLKGKGHGLQITPILAGHMIGGTVWKITKDGEEEIVYGIDYNHKKERHLNGANLDSITRPSILITDCFNILYNQQRRKIRDQLLMDTILKTVRGSGSVLLVTDTAGRVLELALMLNHLWTKAGMDVYDLCVVSNVAAAVLQNVKNQSEWMSDAIKKEVEEQRGGSGFQFKHVRFFTRLQDLHNLGKQSRVILASLPDMECGFSRDLFLLMCNDPRNHVIITSRASPGTFSRNLIEQHSQAEALEIQVRKRVQLQGSELDEFRRRQAEQKAKEKAAAASVKDNDSDDEDEVAEFQAGKGKLDLMVRSQPMQKKSFFKQPRKAFAMFPYTEEKIRYDDYGEIINAQEYIDMLKDVLVPGVDRMEVGDDKENTTKNLLETEVQEVPTKVVSSNRTFDIRCSIQFIDFEGRSDGDSVKRIIARMKPKQLILVHGTTQSTEALVEYIKTSAPDSVTHGIYTPRIRQPINLTIEKNIYQVWLRDQLVSALKFKQVQQSQFKLTWIDSQLLTSSLGFESAPKLVNKWMAKQQRFEQMEVDEEGREAIPTLDKLPQNKGSPHEAVFVNEPRLSELKNVMIDNGIAAEFSGGTLICNGVVAIKKTAAGKIELEGTICDDYYRVKNLLYRQFTVL